MCLSHHGVAYATCDVRIHAHPSSPEDCFSRFFPMGAKNYCRFTAGDSSQSPLKDYPSRLWADALSIGFGSTLLFRLPLPIRSTIRELPGLPPVDAGTTDDRRSR